MSEAISSMRKLLLVEDEIVFARAVKKRLKRDSSLQVEIAGNLTEARRSLAIEAPDLVLLDMRLPDGSGLDLLEEIKQEQKTLFSVMVMSAYGELEDAVSAMKLGATDYLKKPIDLDELYLNVKKVLHSQENTRKLEYSSKRESHASTESKMVFLGDCAALAEIKKKAQRIAELTHNSGGKCPTVLVLGETGTGKDVFARMLHEISSRADRPFVHVDCASLPKELMEAELFGHEKGAFTDARQSRVGLIEAAEDGVLFLDEIGELSLEMQTKLLAVLERRTLRRIGSTRERCVNAWFIAATNRDLEALSARQQFRRDLYHRLNVLNISMPPLRVRGEDIILLAQHFAAEVASNYNLGAVQMTEGLLDYLQSKAWPGNIRELKHWMESAVLIGGSGKIDVPQEAAIQKAPIAISLDNENGSSLEFLETAKSRSESKHKSREYVNAESVDEGLEAIEIEAIRKALHECNGNISETARVLGISRMKLRYRISKYGIEVKKGRFRLKENEA